MTKDTKKYKKPALFVTGGSGFLGAHFIWHLLTKTDFHIIANMRAAKKSTKDSKQDGCSDSFSQAKQRLMMILEQTAHSYGLSEDRIVILETLANAPNRISIALNNLGVKNDQLNYGCSVQDVENAQFRNDGKSEDRSLVSMFDIQECWHFAGYLTPEKKLTEYDDYENVTMTQNALQLATGLGVSHFYHVSTAYVSGRQDGVVKERLFDFSAPVPAFRNSYERSKYLSEKRSCAYSDKHNLPLTILRPSIVIGPRATKDNGGSQSGFYGVLRAFWRLGGRALSEPIKIPVSAQAGLDLIPVDDFLSEIWQIRQEQRAASKKHQTDVYHLCAGQGVKPDKVVMLAATQYNAPVEPQVIEEMEKAEITAKVLASQLDFYSDYVGPALDFERRRPAPPLLTDSDVLNYITSIARVYAYGSIDDIFNISVMKGHDDIKLPVFDTGVVESHDEEGDSKTILFCHAMGMGAEILIPLGYHLKKAGHRLITWEARILPTLTPDFESLMPDDDHVLDSYAKDGIAIIDQLKLTDSVFQVAGWSTGAGIAGRLVALSASPIEQLHLLNGSFMLEGTKLTSFQRNMNLVMPHVAKSREMTEQLYDMVFDPPHRLKWWNVSSKVFRHQANKIMGANDPRLEHITRQPVRDSESAYRYASQISGYSQCTDWSWMEKIECPIWVMTCQDDTMTHPSGSIELHERLQSSSLKIYQEGDHFKLYQDEDFFTDYLKRIADKL